MMYLIGISALMSFLIAVAIVVFAIRYRRHSPIDHSSPIGDRHNKRWLEVAFIAVPMVAMAVMFVWGTNLYLRYTKAPADAMQINVLGKQWMWKFQHPEGQREI